MEEWVEVSRPRRPDAPERSVDLRLIIRDGQDIGIIFGRVAMRHGVIVLNDPDGLAQAANKMYFQLFPEEVRPTTLITRDRDRSKAFVDETAATR